MNDHILEKLRQTIDSWSGEVSGAQDSLARQIAETRSELTRLVSLIQKQSGDDAATDPDTIIQLALLQEELEELKQKRTQERRSTQQLRLDYAVIQNKLQMATVTLESVLSENAALKRAATDAEPPEDSGAPMEALQQELEDLQAEHQALTERHSSLATDHERAMAELNASRTKMTSVERRSHQLTEDQEALQLQVSRLQERIVEKEKEIAALQQASVENAAASETESNLRQENNALKGELETLRERFQEQAATLEEHITSIREFQNREAEFAERESALQSEIESLKSRLETASEASTEMESRTQAASDKQQAEMQGLQTELDEQRTLNAAHQNTIEKLRKDIETRITGSQESADANAAHVAELQGQLEEQNSINASQTSKIASLQAELRERDEAIAAGADVERNLEARTQELQNAQAYIAELQQTVDAQKQELEALHSQIGDEADDEAQPASPFDAFDDNGQQRAIGEILLDAEIINETQLFNALVEQDKFPNRRIGSILLEQGLIQEDTVAKVLASQLRLEYVDLDDTEFQAGALAMMDGRSATHHMAIPVRIDDENLVMAMANPLDQIALEDLERATGKRIQPIVAPLSDITAAIVRKYSTDFGRQPQSPPREESVPSTGE